MTKILIIEDDPLLSQMYRKMFESAGYEVSTAEDGQTGLDLVRANPPTLILLDIMMPKLNGMQVLERLKSDPNLAKIPVIVLTNLSGTMDAEKALKLGAVKYIVKSEHKPKEVAEIVKEVLAAHAGGDETPKA